MDASELIAVLLRRARGCLALGVTHSDLHGYGWEFNALADLDFCVHTRSPSHQALMFRQWIRGAAEEHCAKRAIDYCIGTDDPLVSLDSILDAIEKHECEARR